MFNVVLFWEIDFKKEIGRECKWRGCVQCRDSLNVSISTQIVHFRSKFAPTPLNLVLAIPPLGHCYLEFGASERTSRFLISLTFVFARFRFRSAPLQLASLFSHRPEFICGNSVDVVRNIRFEDCFYLPVYVHCDWPNVPSHGDEIWVSFDFVSSDDILRVYIWRPLLRAVVCQFRHAINGHCGWRNFSFRMSDASSLCAEKE